MSTYDPKTNPTGTDAPTGYVNPNAGTNVASLDSNKPPQTTTPVATTTPSSVAGLSVVTPPTASGATTPPDANAPLSMPASGSIVDLLNSAGIDSSAQNRANLAKQFGISGYANTGGTKVQNEELAKKYIAAHNAVTAKPAPQTASLGRAAAQDVVSQNTTPIDPQQSFFDSYASMNPVVKSMYDMIYSALSPSNTTQTFTDEYNKLLASQGVPGIQTQLLNIQNVMNGTEEDIRTEIAKTGGFATESQVQALTATRNKVLLKQANTLSNILQTKEDYVNQVMQFSKADREQINSDLDRKIGLTEKMATIQDTMNANATKNYQKIVDNIGYTGLASTFEGNPTAARFAESLLNLPGGVLSDPAWIAQADTFKQKQLSLSQQKVQISLLNADSLKTSRDALTLSRYNSTITNVIKQLYATNKNPIQIYTSSAQAMNRIQSSLPLSLNPNNPDKAAPDLDLVDAYVQIARGGQQITEAQVATLLQGLGISAKFDVAKQKVTGTGILDNGTRKSIADVSKRIFEGQKTNADQSVGVINKRLASDKVPEDLWLQSVDDAQIYIEQPSDSSQGQIINYNGKRYQTDADGNFDPNNPL